jgi:ABC-2 type transport system permease protein
MTIRTPATPQAPARDLPPEHPSGALFERHAFAGTRGLTRLALRRDRVLIPVWLAVFVAMAGSTASSTLALYPDIASRREIATTINGNPAMLALYGRIFDVESAGAVAMFKVNAMGAALVAVLTMILLVRHTRAEEEAGRLELLGAGVVGRHAALTAALLVSGGTAVVLGLLTAASLIAAGLPVAGSLAFGLSWTLTGLSFTAVAAVTAQLTTGARAATGLTAAVLGATYLLRAVGDVADEDGPRWLSWLSPVGWAQQVRPFAGVRWWVFAPGLLFVALATFAAYVLVAGRDVGAGLLADRPGRPAASASLSSAPALALRLQRGLLLAWTGAMLVMGLVVGSLGSSIDAFLESPEAKDMIARMGGSSNLLDAFFGTELGAVALIVSIFAIQAVLRLRAEESGLRAEALLATALDRRRFVLSHLLVSALGSTWLLAVAGLGMGITASATLHDGAWFGRLLGAALVQVPAVLVMAGFTLAAFGLVPRFAAAGWALLVGVLLIGELGPIFEVDQRVLDISPFVHVPRLGEITAAPLVWLMLVALALAVLGTEAFRRRDVQS